MINKTFVFFLLSFLYLNFSANAENVKKEPQIITLQEVFNSVNKTFPLLEIAKQEKKISENILLSSQGAFDTSLNIRGIVEPLGYYNYSNLNVSIKQPTTFWGTNVFGGWRIGLGKYPIYEGKLETNSLGEFRAGLEIPLLKNGFTDRRRINIQKSEIENQIAELKIFTKIIESYQKSSDKYWKWISAGNRQIISEDLLKMALKRDKDISQSVKLGQSAPIESLENKRAIFQRKQQLINSERIFSQSSNELGIYLRDNNSKTFIPKIDNVQKTFKNIKSPENFKLEKDLEFALDNNPELKIINLKIQQNEYELELAKNQNLPSLDLQLAISQDIGTGSETRVPFEFDTAIVFDLPFQMRVSQAKISEIENKIIQLNTEADFLKDNIITEVKNNYLLLKATFESVELARAELVLAKDLEKAEYEKFKLGDSTILIVNLREQAISDAAIREISSITDYFKSIIDYKMSISDISYLM